MRRHLIALVLIFVVAAMFSGTAAADGDTQIIAAKVEGLTLNVTWTGTAVGYYFIYLDDALAKVVPGTYSMIGVYTVHIPALTHWTTVYIEHRMGDDLLGYDWAWIDWSGAGGGGIGGGISLPVPPPIVPPFL